MKNSETPQKEESFPCDVDGAKSDECCVIGVTLHCLFCRRIAVRGKFLGRDNLIITASDVKDDSTKEVELVEFYPVSIIRKASVLDTVFVVVIAVLVSINTVNMGCHLDLQVVKDNLKRPCAIGIGFTSQYVFMPLVRWLTPVARLLMEIFLC